MTSPTIRRKAQPRITSVWYSRRLAVAAFASSLLRGKVVAVHPRRRRQLYLDAWSSPHSRRLPLVTWSGSAASPSGAPSSNPSRRHRRAAPALLTSPALFLLASPSRHPAALRPPNTHRRPSQPPSQHHKAPLTRPTHTSPTPPPARLPRRPTYPPPRPRYFIQIIPHLPHAPLVATVVVSHSNAARTDRTALPRGHTAPPDALATDLCEPIPVREALRRLEVGPGELKPHQGDDVSTRPLSEIESCSICGRCRIGDPGHAHPRLTTEIDRAKARWTVRPVIDRSTWRIGQAELAFHSTLLAAPAAPDSCRGIDNCTIKRPYIPAASLTRRGARGGDSSHPGAAKRKSFDARVPAARTYRDRVRPSSTS